VRIENFRVAFDASRASLVSKIMKRRISVTWAIIGACSIAFAREPLPIKWAIDGAKREATVFPLSTSTATKAPCDWARIDGASLRWTNKIAQHRLDS